MNNMVHLSNSVMYEYVYMKSLIIWYPSSHQICLLKKLEIFKLIIFVYQLKRFLLSIYQCALIQKISKRVCSIISDRQQNNHIIKNK